MKRAFGWRLQDILYVRLLDSCRQQTRWDSKALGCPERREDLDEDTLRRLRPLLEWDAAIYELASQRLRETLRAQPADFWDELQTFRRMQADLAARCQTVQADTPSCQVYRFIDMEVCACGRRSVRARA